MVRIPSTPSTIFHDLIDLHDLSLNCENKQKNLNFKKLAKFGHFYINLPAFQEQTYIANVQCFFKKWANPGLFFVYFRLFKQTLQFFTTNKCEKCPSSIWCRDSNPQPSEYESPPITTRPGLPPFERAKFIRFAAKRNHLKKCQESFWWDNGALVRRIVSPRLCTVIFFISLLKTDRAWINLKCQERDGRERKKTRF